MPSGAEVVGEAVGWGVGGVDDDVGGVEGAVDFDVQRGGAGEDGFRRAAAEVGWADLAEADGAVGQAEGEVDGGGVIGRWVG